MTIPRAVSADSHVVEPFDLWTERIDRAFLDRAPHVETRDDGVNCFYMEGRRPQPIRPLGTPFAMWGKQEEEGRRGGWDPAARIEDMAIDGILAEVLYPSMALVIFGMEGSSAPGRLLPRLQQLARRLLRRLAQAPLRRRAHSDVRRSRGSRGAQADRRHGPQGRRHLGHAAHRA